MKKSDCKRKWKKWRKWYRKAIQRLNEDNSELRKENTHLKSLLDQEMADHAACRKALQHVNWQFNNRLKAEVAAGFRDGKTLEWREPEMSESKRKKLEAAGWKVGDVVDFLGEEYD